MFSSTGCMRKMLMSHPCMSTTVTEIRFSKSGGIVLCELVVVRMFLQYFDLRDKTDDVEPYSK